MLRLLLICLCLLAWPGAAALAQDSQTPAGEAGQPAAAEAAPTAVPKHPKPDLSRLERLRFLTDSDYPPFNYLDEDGALTGFNVDLARAICSQLGVECEVRAVSWDALLPALANGETDAVIASLRVDEDTLLKVDFTESYYHTPARFVARKASPIETVTPEAVEGRKIGVVKGTAHEAYLRDFFSGSEIVAFGDTEQAKEAVKEGHVDLLFGDAISLMFWLNGTTSNACCEFRGGPFTEAKYFGEGVGIAVKTNNRKMRDILDYGLEQVRASGRFEELLLRYFPMSFF